MGSTKKHKEKDRERDEKKSHKHRDIESSHSHSSKKVRKHRSRSKSLSPTGESPPAVMKERERGHKRKHREKRRHEEESEDSDVPLHKTSRHEESREESKSPSPTRQSGDGSSLSIQETNKLRAKLGLKPLQIDSGPSRPSPQQPSASASKSKRNEDLEDGEQEEEEFDEETLRRIREEREKEGETFWKEKKDFVHAPAENITQKIKSDKLRDKINTMKDKRKLESKMFESKGLADSDEEDLDASKWVSKQKTLADQKALADKRAKELDELDTEFGVGEVVESEFMKSKNKAYTGKDLKGIKVLHDQSRLREGQQMILTLKDKGVLDEEDDTLINVNLIDEEKFEKNVENKSLRPELHGYNALDEIEYDDQGNLKVKTLLGKYDEEISGPDRQSFVIGQNVSEEARRAKIREKMQRADKILESAEGTSLRLASDFFTPEEMVAFKKPKKKIRKVRKNKVLRADDLLKLDTDINTAPEGVINQRDLRSKKKSSHDSETVKNESVDMEIDMEIDDFAPRIDVDVSDVRLEDEADIDFQMALSKARKLQQKQKVKPKVQNMADLILQDIEAEKNKEVTSGSSIVLHATAEFCRTLGDIPSVDAVDLYGDEEMDFEQEEKYNAVPEERGAWNEVDIDETPVDITRVPEHEDAPILEEEPNVGIGLAGALKLAQTKGYLEQEQVKRLGAATMRHLEAKHYTIEDKNYEEEQRESKRNFYAGPTTDFREKDGYKPEVKLEYNDEDGKPISAKEAFRLLSHKFHGKGSGKNKIDKKRKKMEQEKLMQHMHSTDTPLGTLELLQQRQKDTHSAYIVLTGSKAHNSLSKSKR